MSGADFSTNHVCLGDFRGRVMAGLIFNKIDSGKLAKVEGRGFVIRASGFFRSIKSAKMNLRLTLDNFRRPSLPTLTPPDAFVARFIVGANALVHGILRGGGCSDVSAPIIESITVNMVENRAGYSTKKPMHRDARPVDPRSSVPAVTEPPIEFSNSISIRRVYDRDLALCQNHSRRSVSVVGGDAGWLKALDALGGRHAHFPAANRAFTNAAFYTAAIGLLPQAFTGIPPVMATLTECSKSVYVGVKGCIIVMHLDRLLYRLIGVPRLEVFPALSGLLRASIVTQSERQGV